MASMLEVWEKAAAFATRWLSVGVLIVGSLGLSRSRVGGAPGVKQVDLRRQAATDGAATPRFGCSTAWAVG